jgi:hypothetical protein
MSARQQSDPRAVDQRLAGIHLRLGSLPLARAELEQLAAGDRLDVAGLSDLAEVRWRTGDLEPAAAAAAAHLAAGGDEPIARIIAAEAAAAAGRPGEARSHVAAVNELSAAELEGSFAGMPRRALWPAGPAAPGEAFDVLEAPGASPGRGSRRRGARTIAEPVPGAGAAAPDPVPGLWPSDDGPRADAAPTADGAGPSAATDPAELLGRGRADLRAGDPDQVAAGLDRLALALRLDPTLAPGVLEALGRHREAAALVVRGDACRILGRVLEAEAAYVAAALVLDGEPIRRPS